MDTKDALILGGVVIGAALVLTRRPAPLILQTAPPAAAGPVPGTGGELSKLRIASSDPGVPLTVPGFDPKGISFTTHANYVEGYPHPVMIEVIISAVSAISRLDGGVEVWAARLVPRDAFEVSNRQWNYDQASWKRWASFPLLELNDPHSLNSLPTLVDVLYYEPLQGLCVVVQVLDHEDRILATGDIYSAAYYPWLSVSQIY